jgi:hypothetical protein
VIVIIAIKGSLFAHSGAPQGSFSAQLGGETSKSDLAIRPSDHEFPSKHPPPGQILIGAFHLTINCDPVAELTT